MYKQTHSIFNFLISFSQFDNFLEPTREFLRCNEDASELMEMKYFIATLCMKQVNNLLAITQINYLQIFLITILYSYMVSLIYIGTNIIEITGIMNSMITDKIDSCSC